MASITASARTESPLATGVLFVHSCPRSSTSHIEWALARELGRVVKLDWSPQTLKPGTMRAAVEWIGPAGTAAALTSALFGGQQLRFEITEDHAQGRDGGRWMHTPALGVFRLQTDAAGNGVLTENVVRDAIAQASGSSERLADVLVRALGEAWDRELEPFRAAETRSAEATIFLSAS